MEASLEVFNPKLGDEHSSWGIRNIRALQRELNSNIEDRNICLGEQWPKQSFLGMKKPVQNLERESGTS